MSRCFTIHSLSDRLDRANLDAFGQHEVLIKNRINIWEPDYTIECIVDALERVRYNPDSDIIVLTGSGVHLVYLTAALNRWAVEFDSNISGVPCIVFNANDSAYRPLTLPVNP